jgi:hypothetical protein
VGRGARAAVCEKEDENEPVLRKMLDDLFTNHLVVAPSGKGSGAILLPSGWDGDFQVGQDLQNIVMLKKVPKVMHDAHTCIG